MDRFWSKVDVRGPDDCWLWTAADNGKYGRFYYSGRLVGAHQFSLWLATGSWPAAADTCHSCDTTLCCNPRHLFEGTRTENMRDASTKGRMARGERHGNAKVSDEIVIEVCKYYETGLYTQRQVARKFGVSQMSVSEWSRGVKRCS